MLGSGGKKRKLARRVSSTTGKEGSENLKKGVFNGKGGEDSPKRGWPEKDTFMRENSNWSKRRKWSLAGTTNTLLLEINSEHFPIPEWPTVSEGKPRMSRGSCNE